MEEKPPIPPHTFPPSLLDQAPPTPPEVIQRMQAGDAEHNHYAAIGRVAAAWAHFEALVDIYSTELAQIDAKTGLCFTTQIAGSGRKLDAYISLARLSRDLPEKLIKELNIFAKDTRGLSEQRNRIVHDLWFFNHPAEPERLEASAKKLLRFEYIPTSTEALLKFSTQIDNHAEKFVELTDRIAAAPYPSPETPPPGSAP
jgi:hypothetical protein